MLRRSPTPPVRVVSIDFWETLYVHGRSRTDRNAILARRLGDYLTEKGVREPDVIASSLFDDVETTVMRSWDDNAPLSPVAAVQQILTTQRPDCPRAVAAELVTLIYALFRDELKPIPAGGARELLEWASQRFPVYLVSNTYTLTGGLLDAIMASDDLLRFFEATLYSDVIGRRKPDPFLIQLIAERQRVVSNSIVHVGDQVERDAEMARRAGCRCILIGGALLPDRQLHERWILRQCASLADVRVALEEAGS